MTSFKKYRNRGVILGPVEPPRHGASALTRILSNEIPCSRFATNISKSDRGSIYKLWAFCVLLNKVMFLSLDRALVFTASETPGKLRDFFILLILILRRIPICVAIHNNPFYNSGILGWLHILLSSKYSAIFSYESQEYVAQKRLGREVCVIRTCAPNENKLLNFPIKHKVFRAKGEVNFLMCSNVLPFKNIDLAIEFILNFSKNATVDILGRCDDQYGRSLVERFGSRRVRFHGFVEGNRKYQFIKSADVLVHLSDKEEFPLVEVECLAAGLPFIAFDGVGGLSTVVSTFLREKFFVERDALNQDVFNSKVDELIDDTVTRQMMRSFYEDNFSSARMVKEYKQCLFGCSSQHG